MNGYDLTRAWFNFRFGKKNVVKPIHTELYFYCIDLWNRLGQPKEFGLPTDVSMNSLGIGSYSTYKKALDHLIEFGFVKEVSGSKNQFQSRVIALTKSDKATGKSLDKALIKATDKASDKSTDETTAESTEAYINKEQGTISKYHYGDKSPKQKKEIKHWKLIVDIWFEFYKSKFGNEPTFNATAGKNLKSILNRIEKLYKKKNKDLEWTEAAAKRSFDKFLENAWSDTWMQENFLLTNLSSKFDSITNKKIEADGKGQKNQSTGKSLKVNR